MRLLVTRPEPAAARTAANLRARGHDVLLAPVLRIACVADAELGHGPFGAVVLTSANAVRALAQHRRRAELQSLPAFVVGRRTADAARGLGFGDVISADGNQQDLVRLVGARDRGGGLLLYLAGEHRMGDLGAALAAIGLQVRTVVIYRAVPADALPAEVVAALAAGQVDGVLHFSRRSATAFLQCAIAAGVFDAARSAAHYCLSEPVAEPLRAAGAAQVMVAPRPEEAVLIGCVSSS